MRNNGPSLSGEAEYMNGDKTLSELIKIQVKLERETAEKLQKIRDRLDSLAARLLVREMQLDTMKHAEILEEALRAFETPKSFWDYNIHIEADKRTVKQELLEHIKVEEKMRKRFEEEMKKTDDEALKMILQNFLDDEKKHHIILNTILKKAYKTEL